MPDLWIRLKLSPNRKLTFVGIIPYQILFPFSGKDRNHVVAQWYKQSVQLHVQSVQPSQDPGLIPGRAALCFAIWSSCQFFYLCRRKGSDADYVTTPYPGKIGKSILFNKGPAVNFCICKIRACPYFAKTPPPPPPWNTGNCLNVTVTFFLIGSHVNKKNVK